MDSVRVGFDVGPMIGPRSGVGLSVAAMHDELGRRADVEVVDYLVSFRAPSAPGRRRLPMPAALAHRCWAATSRPRADRWLGALDVIHGTNYVVPPASTPRLVTVHDCWFLRQPDELVAGAVRRSGKVLRRSLAEGAAVHAPSEATASAVRQLFPGTPVTVVHWGALPLAPPPDVAPIPDLVGVRYILAIGTLERRKNLATLVRAFGRIAGDHPGLRLVLAGSDGDDRRSIDAAVDALGADADRVLFVGRVDDAVRSWLLHRAAVVAYPSLDEGFGFPLLDAMQADVPVVASDAGAIPEVAADAALYCAAADIDALAANLHEVLGHPATAERLVANGRRRREEFRWSDCAQRLAGLYHSLAEGSR